MIEFLEYARKAFKEIPKDRWQGSSASGKPVVVLEHHAGVDFGRGPWVKFKFKEGADEKELQGYRTWHKGDRIKFGPAGGMKECDDDHLDYTGAADIDGAKVKVILKFKFDQDGAPFSYRFEGKSN
jgi:hypothetical protein